MDQKVSLNKKFENGNFSCYSRLFLDRHPNRLSHHTVLKEKCLSNDPNISDPLLPFFAKYPVVTSGMGYRIKMLVVDNDRDVALN